MLNLPRKPTSLQRPVCGEPGFTSLYQDFDKALLRTSQYPSYSHSVTSFPICESPSLSLPLSVTNILGSTLANFDHPYGALRAIVFGSLTHWLGLRSMCSLRTSAQYRSPSLDACGKRWFHRRTAFQGDLLTPHTQAREASQTVTRHLTEAARLFRTGDQHSFVNHDDCHALNAQPSEVFRRSSGLSSSPSEVTDPISFLLSSLYFSHLVTARTSLPRSVPHVFDVFTSAYCRVWSL